MSNPDLIRFSDINVDRLNKAMLQLHGQLVTLSNRLAKLEAKPSGTAAKPNDYPGIEAGSKAMIGGPVPGGPSPIPPFIKPHSLIVGEGSTPTKEIVGTDGQVPIACTGNDPAFANLGGDGTSISSGIPYGVAIISGCNTLAISLNDSVNTWIHDTQLWMNGMKTWTATVSAILGITPPSPDPPASAPT
jgi:hypothetical protein